MIRLAGCGEGKGATWTTMIMLGMYASTDIGVLKAVSGRGLLQLQESYLSTGCRIFTTDGSDIKAWIPFFEGQSDHRDMVSVWNWLVANGCKCTCLKKEPAPIVRPNRLYADRTPIKDEAPEPKGTQGSLF